MNVYLVVVREYVAQPFLEPLSLLRIAKTQAEGTRDQRFDALLDVPSECGDATRWLERDSESAINTRACQCQSILIIFLQLPCKLSVVKLRVFGALHECPSGDLVVLVHAIREGVLDADVSQTSAYRRTRDAPNTGVLRTKAEFAALGGVNQVDGVITVVFSVSRLGFQFVGLY